jgi:hypothetical protein
MADNDYNQQGDTNGNKKGSGKKDDNGQTRPKVLSEHPALTAEQEALLERKRQNRLPDSEAGPLADYYAWIAQLDPNRPEPNPYQYQLAPTPRGGLDAIVREHLGNRPALTKPANDYGSGEIQAVLEAQAKYDTDYRRYKHLLFTMNRDTLRADDRYTVGQLLRVPTEFV